MARIRTVKPDFWEDEGVSALSRDARLLFIATWNLADDEGLLRWTPEHIKAQVFSYDHDLTAAKVTKLMAELVDGDFLFPYIGGRSHQQLAFVIRFLEHQRINRPQPSKLPPPQWTEDAVRQMIGRRDGMRCGICGEQVEEVTEAPVNGFDAPPGNRYHAQFKQRLSLDHVDPQSKGGNHYPSNLQAAHMSCNKSRGNRPLPESPSDSVNVSVNDSVNATPLEVEVEVERKGSGKETLAPKRAGGPKPTHNEPARQVVQDLWQRCGDRKPVLAGRGNAFMAAVGIAEKFLEQGIEPETLTQAMLAAHLNATISIAAVNMQLTAGKRNRNGRDKTAAADRILAEFVEGHQ